MLIRRSDKTDVMAISKRGLAAQRIMDEDYSILRALAVWIRERLSPSPADSRPAGLL